VRLFAENGSIVPEAHGIPGTAGVQSVSRAATVTRAWKYCVFFAPAFSEKPPLEFVVSVFVFFSFDALGPEKMSTATSASPSRFSVSFPESVYDFVFFTYFAVNPSRTGMFTNARACMVPAGFTVPVPTVHGVATRVQP